MKKIVGFLARAHGLNALETLLKNPNYQVVCVFTHRLNPKSEDPNRGERTDYPDFVKLAKKHQIPLYAIDSKAEEQTIESILKKLSFDFIVSVSWRRKISPEILNLPKEGSINLHRGLLPNYPGAEPIKQALQNHEKIIAITAHEMAEEIDVGRPLAYYFHEVNFRKNDSLEENVDRLKKELTPEFGPLLIEALEKDRFPIKWLLVDFDGTLVNTLPVLKKIYLDFLKSHELKGTEEEFQILNGLTINEIVTYLKKKYHLPVDSEQLQKKYEALLLKRYLKDVKLHPNAKETLSELKKQRFFLAIVSSAPREFIQEFLKKNDLENFFAAVISAEAGLRGKPYPDIYTHALKTLKIKPKEALAIEDSENGIQAALKAGISTLCFNSHQDSSAEGVLTVKDWNEVKLAIQGLIDFYYTDDEG